MHSHSQEVRPYIPATSSNIWSRGALVRTLEGMGHKAFHQEFRGAHYVLTPAPYATVARVAAALGVVVGSNTRLGFSNAVEII